jgi:hypothetical protein
MDHFNVKLFAEPGTTLNWADLIPVFHRWIRESAVPGSLIDVADYAHVPEGPGVMLIGDDGFYSVDNRAGELGVLYNRRRELSGDARAKLEQAYDTALIAAKLLEKEVPGLRFREQDFEVFVNDRMLAPNTEETDQSVRPVVEEFCGNRGLKATISRDSSDARSLYRLRVRPAA